MFKKEYYRLEDLHTRFNMAATDVIYLLEKRLIKACFYIENTDFIIGEWKQSDFIGYAHVSYHGLVSTPENELHQLIKEKKLRRQVTYLST